MLDMLEVFNIRAKLNKTLLIHFKINHFPLSHCMAYRFQS